MRTFLAILILMPMLSGAQQKAGEPDLKLAIKGDFRLPTPIANRGFRRTVDGVGDFNFSIDYPLFKGVTIGLGGAFSIYQIDDFAITQRTNGQILLINPSIKLAYQKFVTDRIFIDVGANPGLTYFDVISETCSVQGMGRVRFNAPSLGSYFQAMLLAGGDNNNMAFGVVVGHKVIFDYYDPEIICLDKFSGYLPVDFIGPYHMYSVGFSFSVFLHRGNRSMTRTGPM